MSVTTILLINALCVLVVAECSPPRSTCGRSARSRSRTAGQPVAGIGLPSNRRSHATPALGPGAGRPRRGAAERLRPLRPCARRRRGRVRRRARISPAGSCSSEGRATGGAWTRRRAGGAPRSRGRARQPSASSRLACSWATRIRTSRSVAGRLAPRQRAKRSQDLAKERKSVRPPRAVRGEHRADAAAAVGVGADDDPLAREHAVEHRLARGYGQAVDRQAQALDRAA